MPQIKTNSEKSVASERKKTEIHKTTFIGKDDFNVVADDEGNIITDMELLAALRALRFDIAKEKGIAPYQVINNQGLVSLATYRPASREEFIALYGLGKVKFDTFGMLFIEAIKKYYAEE